MERPTELPRLALHLDLNRPIAESVERARIAEAAGAGAVHVIEGTRDPFVPLAAIAAATTSVQLGTYVANAYARSPQAAANAALALDELSGGRFTFGVGAGNWHLNEWMFGVDSHRPMAKLRDYLAVVGAMLSGASGHEPDVGGPHHRIQRRFVRPVERPVPVVLAAAGPRMIELAAAATNGVGLGLLISPEHLAGEIRPRAQRAAEAAGRDPAAVRFPMATIVNANEDDELARHLSRRGICALFHPVPHPYYEFLLRAQGYGEVVDALADLASQQRWREAVAAIPDEIVDRLTITGTPERCADRLADYRDLSDEVVCLAVGSGAGTPNDESAWAGLQRLFELARPAGAATTPS